MRNLTVALELPLEPGSEIWVAAGTYTPDGSAVWQAGNEVLTFQLRSGVGLYGGFVGDETALDERDLVVSETILSGDLEEDDDPEDPSTYDRNSHHVVTGANDAVLDGFTVTAGVAGNHTGEGALSDSELYDGAGLINRGTSPTIRNCTFRSNLAYYQGGGIYNMDFAAPLIVDSTFEDNHASMGGAIANGTQAAPQIHGCDFVENEADLGGAIANSEGSLAEIRDCMFHGNYYRAVANRLGAQTVVTDSTFVENEGGMLSEDATLTVTGCSFLDNTSSGVINVETNATFTDCTFEGNSTTSQGGAVANSSGNLSFINCTFSENSATGKGGGAMWNEGVYTWVRITGSEFRSNDGGALAGAVGVDFDSLTRVENSIFADNRADYGGAAHVRMGIAAFTNSTFYLNQATTEGDAIYVDAEIGEALLRNSIVWLDDFVGAVSVLKSNTSQLEGAEDPSNLHVDPLFALGDLGLRLQEGSPCIDAGDVSLLPEDHADLDDDDDYSESTPFDMDGNARIVGSTVDLGPYEYTGP